MRYDNVKYADTNLQWQTPQQQKVWDGSAWIDFGTDVTAPAKNNLFPMADNADIELTDNGITSKINLDGTIDLSGTATGIVYINLWFGTVSLPADSVFLVHGCTPDVNICVDNGSYQESFSYPGFVRYAAAPSYRPTNWCAFETPTITGLRLRILSGTTVNTTIRPVIAQINPFEFAWTGSAWHRALKEKIATTANKHVDSQISLTPGNAFNNYSSSTAFHLLFECHIIAKAYGQLIMQNYVSTSNYYQIGINASGNLYYKQMLDGNSTTFTLPDAVVPLDTLCFIRVGQKRVADATGIWTSTRPLLQIGDTSAFIAGTNRRNTHSNSRAVVFYGSENLSFVGNIHLLGNYVNGTNDGESTLFMWGQQAGAIVSATQGNGTWTSIGAVGATVRNDWI